MVGAAGDGFYHFGDLELKGWAAQNVSMNRRMHNNPVVLLFFNAHSVSENRDTHI